MAHVAERVAPYKKVREVEFIDAVPKNPSGKILRRELKAREAGGDGGGLTSSPSRPGRIRRSADRGSRRVDSAPVRPHRPERNTMPAPTPRRTRPPRRPGRHLGRLEGPRRLVPQRRRRDRRHAVPRAGARCAVRAGRQRPPEAVRPRLPHGGVAGRRGGPVPHRDRVLDVGRDPQRDLPLRHGAPGDRRPRRWRGRGRTRRRSRCSCSSSARQRSACSRTRTSVSTRARRASRSRSRSARTRGRTRRP